MGRSSKASYARLYEIASRQQGYFTTQQALAAGYADNVHPYHVHNGDWRRVIRGMYRLERFPESPGSDLMMVWLWSQNRSGIAQGVFSHQTALAILEGDADSSPSVHLTIPLGFRRKPGDLLVHLHQEILPEEDIVSVGTFRVTSRERTLRDLGGRPALSVSPATNSRPRVKAPSAYEAAATSSGDWAAWS